MRGKDTALIRKPLLPARSLLTLLVAFILFLTTFMAVPQAAKAATVTASGTCGVNGDNLTWTLTDDGTLTISGAGAMTNWSEGWSAWMDYGGYIKTVVINNGVTSIGSSAFFGCDSLTSVTIPNSVNIIGSSAFYGCDSLTSITISNSMAYIGTYAFYECRGLETVYCYMTMGSIGGSAFMPIKGGAKIYALNKDLFIAGTQYNSASATLYGIFTTDFYNHDGTLLQEGYCVEGQVPTYTGTTPTKASDNTYSYTWTGWDKSLNVGIVSNTTYTAQFTPTYINYKITYQRDDGSLIREDANIHYGDTLTPPTNPTKDADNTYTYTFSKWNTTIPATCTGNATYTASFSKTYINYTVEFQDYNGTVLSSATYHYGDTVTIPTEPTRGQENGVNYYFDGWDKEVTTCQGNTTYTATYRSSAQQYSVVFKDWDGTVLSTATYYYGNTVVVPTDPVRAADSENTYIFRGWNYSPTIVTCDITYTATYIAMPKNYCIMFYDWDGRLLFLKSDYHWGENVYEPSPLSAPPSDNELAYTNVFSHWSANSDGTDDFSATVTGSATYTAQFVEKYIDYTVTFENYDGTVLSETTYHYGDTVTEPSEPTKAEDDTYTYSFIGWDKEVSTTCDGNAVYVAQFEPTYINYTVTFKDHDGTVLSEKTDYHWGDSVVVPASPTREATAETVYSFAGWSPDVAPTVTGSAIYVATYAENVAEHTVTFKDWDNSVISSEIYPFGESVVVPNDPYRISDDTYVYEFIGWSPDVVTTVSGAAIYVAQYEPTYIDYTVTFKNYDGTVISEATYHYGDAVVKPQDPYRESGDDTVYYFAGWDNPVTTVTGNTTYTATYSTEERTYTITFLDYDGTPLFVKTDYTYDQEIEPPVDPIRESDGTNNYTFIGWFDEGGNALTDGATVTDDAVYTARYDSVVAEYTITFTDYDGTVISAEIYNYGDTVTVPSDPSRASDSENTYTFIGWSPEVSDTVTGTVTYTAVYTAASIQQGGSGGGLSGGYHVDVEDDLTDDGSEDVTAVFAEVYSCCGDDTCPLHAFSDTSSAEWYHDGVHYCLESGLMSGTTETQFEPDIDATRATVVESLWLLENTPNIASAADLNYVDVSDEVQEAEAIRWATSQGIVNGYGDGSFGPDDSITREQLATILWRYINYKEYELGDEGEDVDIFSFNDALEISDWAFDAMQSICDTGLIQGTPEGNLAPLDSTTRAQIATILLRFCESITNP